MIKRLTNSILITLAYFVIANIGNLIFDTGRHIDWRSTLWESVFMFIFIFLFQQFRNEKH